MDCAKKVRYGYDNFFVLVDEDTGKVKQIVKSSMYAPFTWIGRRKLLRYNQNVTGYDYLLRIYLADGVDDDNSNNTYVEIIKAIDLDL